MSTTPLQRANSNAVIGHKVTGCQLCEPSSSHKVTGMVTALPVVSVLRAFEQSQSDMTKLSPFNGVSFEIHNLYKRKWIMRHNSCSQRWHEYRFVYTSHGHFHNFHHTVNREKTYESHQLVQQFSTTSKFHNSTRWYLQNYNLLLAREATRLESLSCFTFKI